MISLGDPNQLVYKKAVIEGVAPEGSMDIYVGELRVMGENTITRAITLEVTPIQVLFWIDEECNQ